MAKKFLAYKDSEGEITFHENTLESQVVANSDSSLVRVEGMDFEVSDDYGSSTSAPQPPFLESVTPPAIELNAQVQVEVKGQNFSPTTIFTSSNTNNFTVDSYVVNSPSSATLTITSFSIAAITELNANNGSSVNFGSVTIQTKDLTTLIPGGNVTWGNVTAGTTVGEGTLSGNSTSGWNKQATFGSIPANQDGYVEFTYAGPSTNGYGMLGLGPDPTTNSNYNTIDFAIYTSNGTGLNIYENGVSRGSFGSTSVGSVFRVERINGVIYYSKDGNVFYTSTISSTTELFFDSSIYRNASYNNIKMVY